MESENGAYSKLVEVACSRDPSASLDAARELAALPEPARFKGMTTILKGANSLVCDLAASVMEGYGEPGLDALIEALPEARPLSQVKIVSALEHIGQPRATPALVALLNTTDLAMLRTLVIQALGRIGAVQAAPLIRSFANDPDHHVRERVRIALEQLEKR